MSDITEGDIKLVQTCGGCPEQYDAYDPAGRQVGYLRLRHGWFTVDAPDAGGQEVYSAQPLGDGIFDPDERDGYLRAARQAIADHLNAAQGRETSIQVSVTARELMDRGTWDRACEMTGLNPWVVNEGLMDSGDRVTLTLEQAQEIGLIPGR